MSRVGDVESWIDFQNAAMGTIAFQFNFRQQIPTGREAEKPIHLQAHGGMSALSFLLKNPALLNISVLVPPDKFSNSNM